MYLVFKRKWYCFGTTLAFLTIFESMCLLQTKRVSIIHNFNACILMRLLLTAVLWITLYNDHARPVKGIQEVCCFYHPLTKIKIFIVPFFQREFLTIFSYIIV